MASTRRPASDGRMYPGTEPERPAGQPEPGSICIACSVAQSGPDGWTVANASTGAESCFSCAVIAAFFRPTD